MDGPCPTCQGRGRLVRPSVALVGTQFVDWAYWQKVHRLGGADFLPGGPAGSEQPLRFTFAEGSGLCMPLGYQSAREFQQQGSRA